MDRFAFIIHPLEREDIYREVFLGREDAGNGS